MSDHNAPTQISELKVSGHTMALDPGVYCVFSAPGSPAPASETGLPVVRVSAGPGLAHGTVEVTGLSADGWVAPGSATLVRVTQSRADVLVTVYQAKDAASEAPQLQVLRISGGAEAASPGAAAPVQGQGPVPVQVLAHIYGRGDVGSMLGAWVGEPGSKRWIEGFGIAPVDGMAGGDLEYQAVLGRGWLSPWAEAGQFCGSRQMSLPILGLRVRLKGEAASTKRLTLQATFVDGSTVGPVGSGEPCEAESLAALEAFKLVIEDAAAGPRAAKAAPNTAPKAAARKPAKPAPAAPAPARRR